MKKKIAIIGFCFVLALIIISMMQPSEYSVKETITLNQTNAVVITHIQDLKAWRQWSPWFERDPEMELEYSDPSVGRGASVIWKSKSEGDGKQTITDVVENEFVKMKLEFYKPFTGEAYAFFRVKSVEESKTELTWLMESSNKGLVDKFFYFAFGVKSMIQKDFNKGLNNLKKVVEAKKEA